MYFNNNIFFLLKIVSFVYFITLTITKTDEYKRLRKRKQLQPYDTTKGTEGPHRACVPSHTPTHHRTTHTNTRAPAAAPPALAHPRRS